MQNFTLNVTDVILTCATTTCKNTTGPPWRPAGVGEEFSLGAQTKYPGSVTAIQERHLDAAVQFFPLTLIHSDSRWRSLAWLGICDCCQQELWMGRRAETRAHTHTHTSWAQGLLHWCSSQNRRVQVTFKQRNSPPYPSSANTHINLQYTLLLKLLTQSTCVYVSYNIKKANPNRSSWNKRPCQACGTFFLIRCDPRFPHLTAELLRRAHQRFLLLRHGWQCCSCQMILRWSRRRSGCFISPHTHHP